MPPVAHRKLQADDATFTKWLRLVGKKQHNGACLLRIFVDKYTSGDWAKIKAELCKSKLPWWPFLRGTLSAREIDVSKTRYLDRYVFIYNDLPSAAYVGDLLDIEASQISHRLCGSATDDAPCAECAAKNAIISGLKTQLVLQNATPVSTVEDAKMAVLDCEFHRHYILDNHKATPRSEVRKDMLEKLKAHYGSDEALDSHSKLWKRFCAEVVCNRDPSYRAFRCRKRQRVLDASEVTR